MQHYLKQLVVSVLVLTMSVIAQEVKFELEVFTHLNTANVLSVEDGNIYAATTGGIAVYNLSDGQSDSYTTVDGFFNHHFTAMTRNDNGDFILGSIDGSLAFWDSESNTVFNDQNLAGEPIIDILSIADTLWVLSRDFVSVYLYNQSSSRYQFRESYQEFGEIVGNFSAMTYGNKRIWLANEDGLISASSDFLRINLYAGSNWRIQKASDGLPSNNINDAALDNSGSFLYLATDAGLSVYDFATFTTITAGLPPSTELLQVFNTESGLYATSINRVFLLNGNTFSSLYRVNNSTIGSFAVDNANNIWIGTNRLGLINVTSGEKVFFDSPFSNNIGEVLVDSRGWVWCTSGTLGNTNNQGIYVRTENGWQNFIFFGGVNGRYSGLNSSNPIFEDAGGNVWIGSWGGGAVVFDGELNINPINPVPDTGFVWVKSATRDDTLSISTDLELQSKLSPVNTGDGVSTIITDFFYDSFRQSIWILNYFPANGAPLLEYKASSFGEEAYSANNWKSFTGPFGRGELHKIRQDPFGDLWVSTADGIVQVRLTGDTLQAANYREADNLKSNATTSVGTDEDGYVWVGTKSGLNGILGGTVFDFRENYQPIGLNINDVHVDSRNNKWFATEKGLSILIGTGSPFEASSWIDIVPFSSSIPPEQLTTRSNFFRINMPTENLLSAFLDENTGDIYMGTNSGLAVVRNNPFAATFTDFEQLKVGPNPFVINDGQNTTLNFYNLVAGSQVKILTINGQLIRTLNPGNFDEIRGSLAQWDGRNLDGRLVSSGVYVYMLVNEEGQNKAGKVLVIKK